MSAEMLAASRGDDLHGVAASLKAAGAPEDEMAALERQASEGDTSRPGRILPAPGATVRFTAQAPAPGINPEEISINTEEGEEGLEGEGEGQGEGEGEEVGAEGPSVDIQQKEVPAAVFGSIAAENAGPEKPARTGALERLRARKSGHL